MRKAKSVARSLLVRARGTTPFNERELAWRGAFDYIGLPVDPSFVVVDDKVQFRISYKNPADFQLARERPLTRSWQQLGPRSGGAEFRGRSCGRFQGSRPWRDELQESMP